MKRFFIALLLAGTACSVNETRLPELDYQALNAQALDLYDRPVRPGYEGKNPYWNGYSTRFIFAPAFDFKEVEGAKAYRYTASVKGKDYCFTAAKPNLALTPVWRQLPVGDVALKVEGIDAEGQVAGLAGERSFYRHFPFHGPYHGQVRSYKETAVRAMMYIHRLPSTQAWEHGTEADMSFPHNTYPCKTVSAVIRSELMLTHFSPKEKEKALAIAKGAGDFLMRISQAPDAPLAYFPPTYYGNLLASAFELNQGKTMGMEAAKAALALLDLYEYTREEKYLHHALGIARTYVRIQREDGSVPMKLVLATGEAVNDVNASLHCLLYVFRKLHDSFGIDEFEPARLKAEHWMKTCAYDRFEMVGQFEDIRIEDRKPYENLTHWTGVPYLTYALNNGDRSPETLALARDVINFSEDQFVLWDSEPGPDGYQVFSLPGVWEQHRYPVPVDDSAGNLATGWLALYQATGDKLYFAKAKALMDHMTAVQDVRTGRIPTVWKDKFEEEPDLEIWLNCTLDDILALLLFSNFVGEERSDGIAGGSLMG